MEPANIYSEPSAWVAFRWGPSYLTPYENTQFPLDHVNDYLKEIQPAYRDANANPNLQGDLAALIDKIGPCILLGWSTGTGNVMVAATSSGTDAKSERDYRNRRLSRNIGKSATRRFGSANTVPRYKRRFSGRGTF
jgi:hypothetical protein